MVYSSSVTLANMRKGEMNMQRVRKLTVTMLLVMAMLTMGCGSKDKENTKTTDAPVVTEEVSEPLAEETEVPQETEVVAGETDEKSDSADQEEHASDSNVNNAEEEESGIRVYYADSQAEHLLAENIGEQEVTPELLLSELVKHGMVSEKTKINSINETTSESNGKSLVVDFSQEFQDDLFTQGTAGEFLMMGSVVNTFLKAYDAESMTITVNGNPLESGHCIYEKPMKFCDIDENASADEVTQRLSEALGAE